MKRKIIQKMLSNLLILSLLPLCLQAQKSYVINQVQGTHNTFQTKVNASDMISMKELLTQLQKKHKLNFVYNDEVVKDVNFPKTVINKPLDKLIPAMAELLQAKRSRLSKLGDRQYGITSLEEKNITPGEGGVKAGQRPDQIQVTGTVKDSLGNPLVGVTIKVQGGSKGTATDVNGKFSLDV